jgi:POTRA domain-containing FtsQ-type protein
VGAVTARRRTTARTAIAPARRGTLELGRLAPSGRSIAVGLALAVLAAAAYLGARDTSVFAVRTIDVRGGTATLRAQVRAALAAENGRSLVRVDTDSIEHALATVPGVRGFSSDRVFPHTLRVTVQPERAVLVLRVVPGKTAYLVSARGRVMRRLAHSRLSSLPRLWATKDVHATVGDRLSGPPGDAATALAALQGSSWPGGVRLLRSSTSELAIVLGSGFELRLGDGSDLRLKYAVARRILRASGAASAGAGSYLDVSVPERPVLYAKAQVGG